MAIRARLKKKLKTLLGRENDPESSSSVSSSYTPPQAVADPKPVLEPVSPSLEVLSPDISEEKDVPEKDSSATQDSLPETPESVVEEKQEPAVDNETPEEIVEEAAVEEQQEETEKEESLEKITDADGASTEGATFVFAVKSLFPENCPSCDASSHNNWLWTDGAFACGSCGEHYA